MKKSIILAITVGGLLLWACSPSEQKNLETSKNGLEKSITYHFSDSIKVDTFKVVLQGENSQDMALVFTIKSHNGQEIYKHRIKAADLLKSYLATAEMKAERDKIKFLKEEIDFFFDERHFLEPAVTENEEPDKNVPDLAFYNELKKLGLNGFDYRLAKDNKIYIAWSVKEQRVKIYYQCC